MSVIGRFEEALTFEAREAGVDGVICGHIHYADMHDRMGIHYINTGDWVESCTAVAETHEGQFELIRWDVQVVAPTRPKRRRLRLGRRRADRSEAQLDEKT